MKKIRIAFCLLAPCWVGSIWAEDASGKMSVDDAKEMSGMSILGNSEAPKSLVIVPWKTSEIGDGSGVSNMLDGRARPVDKEVFIRELDYYELRTGARSKKAPEAVVSVVSAESR